MRKAWTENIRKYVKSEGDYEFRNLKIVKGRVV